MVFSFPVLRIRGPDLLRSGSPAVSFYPKGCANVCTADPRYTVILCGSVPLLLFPELLLKLLPGGMLLVLKHHALARHKHPVKLFVSVFAHRSVLSDIRAPKAGTVKRSAMALYGPVRPCDARKQLRWATMPKPVFRGRFRRFWQFWMPHQRRIRRFCPFVLIFGFRRGPVHALFNNRGV